MPSVTAGVLAVYVPASVLGGQEADRAGERDRGAGARAHLQAVDAGAVLLQRQEVRPHAQGRRDPQRRARVAERVDLLQQEVACFII